MGVINIDWFCFLRIMRSDSDWFKMKKTVLFANSVALTATIMSGGCSIYPLTEDTTGRDSFEIVRAVRCEARAAALIYANGLLKKYGDVPVYKGLTGNELHDALVDQKIYFYELDWKAFRKEIRLGFEFYARTSVSYDFTLDNTEMNTQAATLDITGMSFGQTDKLPLTLRDEKTREVSRNFRVYDSFNEFYKSKKIREYCRNYEPSVNFHYPLAGSSKIKNLVGNFIDLNRHGNLDGAKDAPKDKPAVPTMADTIRFTTKTIATVTPGIALNPVLNRLIPTYVTFTSDNYRQDLHTVIIVLSLTPEQGGFTTARALLAQRGIGLATADALAAIELNRQKEVTTQNSIDKIGDSLIRLSR